ncbi:DUF4912 domain-containing protein [Entomospira nematocerorum]|uniref:DUF4912 domain-containing protein n=1 Tax=Entomospira nematocerorum TaxID=2719987 RepID=A0A968KUM7_9SPIO|nr:DUF4912 domain-containing protein [Entomospira nematocera]NIZ46368.1 DUF4912 domain-containing protein [Entomospira nematocera]WDI33827.1 DUF4912 domain-containing protein [Entomospira nematocera]
MHRERLQSLSDQELLRIAADQNIVSDDVFDRDFLIEEIYASLVDPFYEENLSASLLSKRYEFTDTIDYTVPVEAESFMQEFMHEQHLYLAVHSPQWLFVDWHISANVMREITDSPYFQALYLRLFALQKDVLGYELLESLDVEIDVFNGRQYLTLPERRAHYKVIIVADLMDRERILAESVITFLIGKN